MKSIGEVRKEKIEEEKIRRKRESMKKKPENEWTFDMIMQNDSLEENSGLDFDSNESLEENQFNFLN